jgi:hypothetical protein
MPFPLIPIGIAAAFAFGVKKRYDKHRKMARGNAPAPGVPVNGLPANGPKAPVGLTPPGVPQPIDRVIALAPQLDVSKEVHDTSAALIEYFRSHGQSAQPIDEVIAFQTAFNKSKPEVELRLDGLYSAKTQGALQSVITPAIAPQSVMSPIVVAPPADPAPAPNLEVALDIRNAANALYEFLTVKKGLKKGSFKEVSTFQSAWNSHQKNSPLVVDGMYGGNGQNALQAVLDWMSTNNFGPKRKALKSIYGSPKSATPVFVP